MHVCRAMCACLLQFFVGTREPVYCMMSYLLRKSLRVAYDSAGTHTHSLTGCSLVPPLFYSLLLFSLPYIALPSGLLLANKAGKLKN